MLFADKLKDQSNSLNSVRFCNISVRPGDHALWKFRETWQVWGRVSLGLVNDRDRVRVAAFLGECTVITKRREPLFVVYTGGSPFGHNYYMFPKHMPHLREVRFQCDAEYQTSNVIRVFDGLPYITEIRHLQQGTHADDYDNFYYIAVRNRHEVKYIRSR